MIYNHRNLQGDDIIILKDTLEKYKDHDKIDLIIELAFDKNKKEKIKSKKPFKFKIQEKEKVNAAPEAIKYCDGDKCQIVY